MRGHFDNNMQPWLQVSIGGSETGVGWEMLPFLIDSGFNHEVAITEEVRRRQQLRVLFSGLEEIGLATGSAYVNTCQAYVDWHGRRQEVLAHVMNVNLIGTRLLRGSVVTLEVKEQGAVEIGLLP